MNVASLELCKELYELSGWYEVETYYEAYPVLGDYKLRSGYPGNILPRMLHDNITPAYDLGYLLRKLPNGVNIMYNNERSAATYEIPIGELLLYADTPEDAATKLAIELLKRGVLEKAS